MTVSVGDTVIWVWVNGTHTTTSMLSIPAGAQAWNSSINSLTTSFSYPVKVEGVYNYNCNIHPTQMIGNFTALSSTGIPPLLVTPSVTLSNSLLSNQIEVSYTLTIPSTIDLRLVDMLGQEAQSFSSAYHTPGIYTETYPLGALPKGMYVLELRSPEMIVTRKIEIQ